MNNDYNIESNNAWKNIGRTPFVTVVTPVYNREDTILRAMQSVERQSYKDILFLRNIRQVKLDLLLIL